MLIRVSYLFIMLFETDRDNIYSLGLPFVKNISFLLRTSDFGSWFDWFGYSRSFYLFYYYCEFSHFFVVERLCLVIPTSFIPRVVTLTCFDQIYFLFILEVFSTIDDYFIIFVIIFERILTFALYLFFLFRR